MHRYIVGFSGYAVQFGFRLVMALACMVALAARVDSQGGDLYTPGSTTREVQINGAISKGGVPGSFDQTKK